MLGNKELSLDNDNLSSCVSYVACSKQMVHDCILVFEWNFYSYSNNLI